MLEIEEALKLVLARAKLGPVVELPALDALGLVLAEAIVSDIDSPPHDKSIVDGFAVVASDVATAGAELSIVDEIMAGQMPARAVEAGGAARIMTGAPIPQGADAVVMVEKTAVVENDRVRILQSDVKSGQNIMRRGASLSQGQTVLQPGSRLRAIELGLLGEVGRPRVRVYGRPRVAILATGNELVSSEVIPGPSQIRNSNSIMLAGLVAHAGGIPVDLGIGRDQAADLSSRLAKGLECDVLAVSGGVSAGVLDLVPAMLESLGVEKVFHKINLKPGKPLWFGVKRQGQEDAPTLVFGLPGNPVSSLVCFELFVRPVIARLLGGSDAGLERITATLGSDFQQRGTRVTMFPASLQRDASGMIATPLPWRGSGDLRTISEAQALIHFPATPRNYLAGESVDAFLL